MKITTVKAIGLRWTGPKISDALSICMIRQALLIRIDTDSGIFGIGESFIFGSSMNACRAIIEEQLAPILIGRDPTDVELLWETMHWRTIANGRTGLVMSAISGVDIALWDIFGKSSGQPIYKLLGAYTNKVPAYASGGFYAPGKDIPALRKELESYRRKGYHGAKIKIGRNPEMQENAIRYMADWDSSVSYEEDLRRLEAARDVIGDGLLIADINAAWPADIVVKYAGDFTRIGLDWLEEPTPFEDEEGCVKIVRSMPGIRVIGYETAQGAENFRRLIERGCMDIVQPDIGWCGGITELRRIGATAAAASKPVSLHSFGSAVHFAASLHVAASLSNTVPIESEENPNELKNSLTKFPFEADCDMNYYVPQGPGLGIELNWDLVEKLSIFG
ncbi:MAG: mandelate racemase/muconate lactonizing enzyme family protein [Oscillospiraceae bacterium]